LEKAISGCDLIFWIPDVIVVGGGVGNIDELYTKGYAWIREIHF
jgi:hypothetical protein